MVLVMVVVVVVAEPTNRAGASSAGATDAPTSLPRPQSLMAAPLMATAAPETTAPAAAAASKRGTTMQQ